MLFCGIGYRWGVHGDVFPDNFVVMYPGYSVTLKCLVPFCVLTQSDEVVQLAVSLGVDSTGPVSVICGAGVVEYVSSDFP